MANIVLTLTEEQAKIVSMACEFYARVRMGQFEEISFRCLDLSIPENEYYYLRDEAERLLLEAREWIYPDLYGFGHSYGYGKFKDADVAFDVHQVIRIQLGDESPFVKLNEPTKCEKVEDGNETEPQDCATINPEDLRPHGKWIGIGYEGYADGNPVYDYWECSVCGNGEDGEDVPEKNPYCRSCGAKMDK